MAICLLGLGSNQGNRTDHLGRALDMLDQLEGVSVIANSTLRETEPVGGSGHEQHFLNAACVVQTALQPKALWQRLIDLERQFGRQQKGDWGPRPLDLDVLLYDEVVIWEPELKIPHPWMLVRPFVMDPAAEIAAEMIHPVLKASVGWLRDELQHAPPHACVLTDRRVTPPTDFGFPTQFLHGDLVEQTLQFPPVPDDNVRSGAPSVLWATCGGPRDSQPKSVRSIADVSQTVRLLIGLVQAESLGALWGGVPAQGVDKQIVETISTCGKPFVLISRDQVSTQLVAALSALGPLE